MRARAKERHMTRPLPLVIPALIVLSTAAEAHTGIGATGGFQHGFVHPFSGLDHVLAMVAVGLYAASLGGRALYLLPAAFLALMAAGSVTGIGGIALPFAELGIALSVVALGAAVAFRIGLPMMAAMGLVGFFAIFHGHAHGAEMPLDASGLSYALGFVLATALLHATGIGFGLSRSFAGERTATGAAQAAGAAIALAGIGLLFNLL
jgi:urease accessory protein